MNKKDFFSKYVIRKWESKNKEKYDKTERKKEKIDMREKNIEEELIYKHEKVHNNKKDLSNQRMAGRDMIIQGLINPYLFDNNYVTDINNQDKFLRPQDSNYKQKIQ
jgi:hypothetical protein|tara:strand:+ start:65 stop:385 length:321 start_codon:yes stop_codon:yes gene_type:complete